MTYSKSNLDACISVRFDADDLEEIHRRAALDRVWYAGRWIRQVIKEELERRKNIDIENMEEKKHDEYKDVFRSVD